MVSVSTQQDVTPMDNAVRIVNRMLEKRKEKYGEEYTSGFNLSLDCNSNILHINIMCSPFLILSVTSHSRFAMQ